MAEDLYPPALGDYPVQLRQNELLLDIQAAGFKVIQVPAVRYDF